MKETGPKPPDLAIVPQANQLIPAEHLTPPQRDNVIKSWKVWGHTPVTPPGEMWKIAFIHIIDGTPTVTAVREIPQLSD